jgi:hypothetical protein
MRMVSCLTLKNACRWTCWALVITAVGCDRPAITREGTDDGNLSVADPSTAVESQPAEAPQANLAPQPEPVEVKPNKGIKFVAQMEHTIADHPQLQETAAVRARFDQVLSQMREEGAEEANSLIFVELQQIESAAGHYEAHEVTLRQSLAYQTMDETQRQELKVLDADLYRRLQEAVERVAQAETFRERVRGLIDGSAYLEVVAKVLEVADHPEVEQSLFEAALEYHSELARLKSSSQIQGYEDSMAKRRELAEEYGAWVVSQREAELKLALLREIWDRTTADDRREMALWPEYMLEVAEAGREVYVNRSAPRKPLPSFMVIKPPTADELLRLIAAELGARDNSSLMGTARAYSAATGGKPDYNQIESEVWIESRATQVLELQIKFHGAELLPALDSVAQHPNPQIADRARSLRRTLK